MRLRFLILMASLVLVDLGITGIFIAVSGRFEVLALDLVANVAILGGANLAGALWLFAPIHAYLERGRDPDAARARIAALPRLASAWVVTCTIAYCAAAFSLGVFMPDTQALRALPNAVLMAGLAWFGFLYALYYRFFAYFAVSDFAIDLKLRLFDDGTVFPPGKGRILGKLLVVFGVAAVVPSALIALDLTAFRGIRAAQGLTVEQTIFLDLLASAFLIAISLVFVTRSLMRPINALTAAVRTLGDGRLDVHVPVMASDELGVLAGQFNAMLADLRDRELIRETFGRYVPNKVASAVLEQKGVLKPQVQTATILFADVEDFTRIAESHPPETVLRMLNEYFSAAIEPINRLGGVVNQFQGDAMLVTFNVPVADPLHADNALAAAMEIQRSVAGMTFAGIPLRVRIGINTGEVIAGAVGSDDRLSYTVHGDAVNLAARLERLNKELGTRVLVSGSTAAALRRPLALDSMGDFGVRGKRSSVSVYALAI